MDCGSTPPPVDCGSTPPPSPRADFPDAHPPALVEDNGAVGPVAPSVQADSCAKSMPPVVAGEVVPHLPATSLVKTTACEGTEPLVETPPFVETTGSVDADGYSPGTPASKMDVANNPSAGSLSERLLLLEVPPDNQLGEYPEDASDAEMAGKPPSEVEIHSDVEVDNTSTPAQPDDFVERMIDHDSDSEEPPVVKRTEQWTLKEKAKPRSKAKAKAKAKAAAKKIAKATKPASKSKPRAKPAARRTRHYLTIDDIVEPTPAPPRKRIADTVPDAMPDPPQASADDGLPAPSAARRKVRSRKAEASVPSGEAAVPGDEEGVEPKVAWGPVSKVGAEAFEKNWPPVQEAPCAAPAADPEPEDDDDEDDVNDEEHVKSFGRCPYPKTIAAQQRFEVIRDVYHEQLEEYCCDALGFQDSKLQAKDITNKLLFKLLLAICFS